MIVVDTNIIAALYLQNPEQEVISAIVAIEPHWLAPALWRSEFRSLLLQYLRHSSINLVQALRLMEYAEGFITEVDVQPASAQILRLAHSTGCSAHDCEFVALAHELGTLLITRDRKVLAAFPTVAMTPSVFLAAAN